MPKAIINDRFHRNTPPSSKKFTKNKFRLFLLSFSLPAECLLAGLGAVRGLRSAVLKLRTAVSTAAVADWHPAAVSSLRLVLLELSPVLSLGAVINLWSTKLNLNDAVETAAACLTGCRSAIVKLRRTAAVDQRPQQLVVAAAAPLCCPSLHQTRPGGLKTSWKC